MAAASPLPMLLTRVLLLPNGDLFAPGWRAKGLASDMSSSSGLNARTRDHPVRARSAPDLLGPWSAEENDPGTLGEPPAAGMVLPWPVIAKGPRPGHGQRVRTPRGPSGGSFAGTPPYAPVPSRSQRVTATSPRMPSPKIVKVPLVSGVT